MTQQISHVTCNCFDCIFKETDIDPKLQVGCKLDKIDAFIKNGAKVEFVEDTLSFEIDRYCKWFRNKEWSDEHKNTDLINTVNKETEFRWSAIIQLNDIKYLSEAIENVLQEPIQPKKIVIIARDNISSIISICGSKIENIPWAIEQPIGEQSVSRCIQMQALRNNLGKCGYYVWVTDNLPIYHGFTRDINHIINEDMVSLMAVLPRIGNHSAIVNKSLHNLFYIDSNWQSIVDKIKILFNENEELRNKHIMSWEGAMTARWT